MLRNFLKTNALLAIRGKLSSKWLHVKYSNKCNKNDQNCFYMPSSSFGTSKKGKTAEPLRRESSFESSKSPEIYGSKEYDSSLDPPPPPPATIIDWHLPPQDNFSNISVQNSCIEKSESDINHIKNENGSLGNYKENNKKGSKYNDGIVDNTDLRIDNSKKMNNNNNNKMIPIRAYFIGTEIDIVKLYQNAIGGPDNYALRKDTVIATLLDEAEEAGYAFFFEYGAVVFCRLDQAKQKSCLQTAKYYSSTLVHNPESDELLCSEDPALSKVHLLKDGKLTLKNADLSTIRVVAGILGQSVALDHHEREVDALLDMFNSLNGNIENTGKMDMKDDDLYRLIAKNNRILTDVIAKFNVMDQARPAGETELWNIPDHYSLWDRLRDEFEIKTRFVSMEYKLELIRENTKFFVDVLAHKQGTRLEWAIIVLIFMELLIAIGDHVDFIAIKEMMGILS